MLDKCHSSAVSSTLSDSPIPYLPILIVTHLVGQTYEPLLGSWGRENYNWIKPP